MTDISALQDAVRAMLKQNPDADGWRTAAMQDKTLWLVPNEVGGLTLLFPEDY